MAYWVKALQLESECSKFKLPQNARPGLGNQPRYEAPDDLKVEIVKTQWLISVSEAIPSNNDLKLAVGQPNRSLTKVYLYF